MSLRAKRSVGRIQAAPVQQAWPLHEKERHFELGYLLSCAVTDVLAPEAIGQLGVSHAGCWECDLADDSLFWSGGVYDIFGVPRGALIARTDAVRFYAEHSRAALDRLRSHAIRHRSGFTLDAEICPPSGDRRWMRLVAVPLCENDQPVRLHGLKMII